MSFIVLMKNPKHPRATWTCTNEYGLVREFIAFDDAEEFTLKEYEKDAAVLYQIIQINEDAFRLSPEPRHMYGEAGYTDIAVEPLLPYRRILWKNDEGYNPEHDDSFMFDYVPLDVMRDVLTAQPAETLEAGFNNTPSPRDLLVNAPDGSLFMGNLMNKSRIDERVEITGIRVPCDGSGIAIAQCEMLFPDADEVDMKDDGYLRMWWD